MDWAVFTQSTCYTIQCVDRGVIATVGMSGYIDPTEWDRATEFLGIEDDTIWWCEEPEEGVNVHVFNLLGEENFEDATDTNWEGLPLVFKSYILDRMWGAFPFGESIERSANQRLVLPRR